MVILLIRHLLTLGTVDVFVLNDLGSRLKRNYIGPNDEAKCEMTV